MQSGTMLLTALGAAVARMATSAPWGWASWSAPALMYYCLTRVTGIPLTEKQAVASKGDAYRAYQREVSAFIPWFPAAR
ncbi:MAG: DUF1295 domain-containing protein [Gemmatimonadaceae bacterium]